MIKICPDCRLSFSGGNDCPRCGPGHPLLDVARASTRRAYLVDRILARTLKTYYGARSAMLLLFWAILVAMVVALALALKGWVAGPGPARAALWALAAILGVALPVTALFLGTRVVRRVARGCIGRRFDLSDIQIERPSPPPPEFTSTAGSAS